MAWRKERLADQIRDILAEQFTGGRLADPRLDGVTVTHVRLSKDLKVATVYYRNYMSKDCEKGLRHAQGFLRHALAEGLDIRRVPDLMFSYDVSVDEGAKIEALVSQMERGDQD